MGQTLEDKLPKKNLIETEDFKKFVQEMSEISLKYNIWMTAVIERDGPKLEYFQLSDEKIKQIRENYGNKTIK